MAFRSFYRNNLTSKLSRRVVGAPASSQPSRNFANSATVEPRVAIVTGSARGIGRSTALRLAQDGYDICVNDVGANKTEIEGTVADIKALGRKAIGVEADVTSYEQVQAMVEKSVRELGPLNTMVANAGVASVKQILDLTEKDFDFVYRVNVLGVQNSFKASALQLIAQGTTEMDKPGKLIAAASVAGMKPFNLITHYSTSKAAVIALTHGYALELAEHHITANSYSPGIVDTPMWDLIDEQMGRLRAAKLGTTFKKGEIFKSHVESIALGRTSVPEDVAKTISFLASSDSNYMTGQNIVIDGGIMYH